MKIMDELQETRDKHLKDKNKLNLQFDDIMKQCKFLSKDNLVLYEGTKTQVRKLENLQTEIDLKFQGLKDNINEVKQQI